MVGDDVEQVLAVVRFGFPGQRARSTWQRVQQQHATQQEQQLHLGSTELGHRRANRLVKRSPDRSFTSSIIRPDAIVPLWAPLRLPSRHGPSTRRFHQSSLALPTEADRPGFSPAPC